MINLRSNKIPQGSEWFVAAAEIVSEFIRAIWNENNTILIKILSIVNALVLLGFCVLSSTVAEKTPQISHISVCPGLLVRTTADVKKSSSVAPVEAMSSDKLAPLMSLIG